MELTITLRHGAADCSELNLLVTAPEDTPFSALRAVFEHELGINRSADSLSPSDALPHCAGTLVEDTDLFGHPPLLDGSVIVWEASRPAAPTGQAAVVDLRIVSGPDAGRRVALPYGDHLIGRSPDADIPLSDRTASRRHATLRVSPTGVTAHDHGASNGVHLDGRPMEGTSIQVRAQDVLNLGATGIVVRPLSAISPTAGRPRGDGTVSFHPAPREVTQPVSGTIRRPTPPVGGEQPRLSWILLLLPLAFSAGAAFLLHSPTLLLFGLLGPVLSLAQHLTDRRHRRGHRQKEAEKYRTLLQESQRRTAVLLAEEASIRRLSCPDLATVVEVCLLRDHRLWARRHQDYDWMQLSVGRGSTPSTLAVHDGEHVEHPSLTDVPVTVAIDAVTGLAPDTSSIEDHHAAEGLLRAFLTQIATWHSPRALRLWVVGEDLSSLADWAWLGRLPHVRAVDDPASVQVLHIDDCGLLRRGLAPLLSELQTRRSSPRAPLRTGHRNGPDQLVVLIGGPRLRENPDLSILLQEGPAHGIAVLCLATDRRDLPAECATTVLVGHHTGLGHQAQIRTPAGSRSVRPDLCPLEVAEEVAHALAPLRDATPSAGHELPEAVRISELVEDAFDPESIVRGWLQSPASTAVAIGRGADGAVRIDLCTDGPHILVGGTTGSGKSELLRSLVAGLARVNRPDRLAFVLIDYKGGSAFDACTALPHVVGLVTDLDDAQTRRALAGLDAELRRRESLLRAAGASDLEEYHRMVDAGRLGPDGHPLTHIARLVVVIDEFRSLADELPDFVSGLVRLAALGRSLGLHLVLATQRPAGIVSADMRANISLRIALRVRDPHDSLDLVETESAARISPRRPGRAVIRGADQEPITVQTAYLGSRRGRRVVPLEVRRVLAPGACPGVQESPLVHSASPPAGSPASAEEADEESTDLHRLVSAVAKAGVLAGAPTPEPPWLPPLPTMITAEEVATTSTAVHDLFDGFHDSDLGSVPEVPDCAGVLRPVLLVDELSTRRRVGAVWHPAHGHLAVVGGARSGRTTAASSFVRSAMEASCPADLSVYVVDASGGLSGLRRYPHVGAYLRLSEIGAVQRLIALFHELGRLSEPSSQRKLLVIDAWEDLRDALDRADHGIGTESLIQALRAGAAVGITVVATGGRGLLSGPISSVLTRRMVLPLADQTDAYLAGVEAAPGRQTPGRVQFSWNDAEAQVALFDAGGEGAGDAPSAKRTPHLSCPGPQLRIRALPAQVDEEDHRSAAPVVVGHSVTVPFGIDHEGAVTSLILDGRSVLIAGPRGSGRTHALELLAEGLAEAQVPHVRCGPALGRSPDTTALPSTKTAFGPEHAEELLSVLQEQPRTVCLVDDVEQIDGRLEEILTAYAAARHTGSVIASGAFADLVDSYRGLVGRLRRSSYGVVLNPGPRAGDLYGTVVSVHEPAVPGRAAVLDNGESRVIQVFRTSRPARTTQEVPTTQSAATAAASSH